MAFPVGVAGGAAVSVCVGTAGIGARALGRCPRWSLGAASSAFNPTWWLAASP